MSMLASHHQDWCSPREHTSDHGHQNTQICISEILHLAELTLYLSHIDGGCTKLSVASDAASITLTPDQIRPLAMGLLAYDAIANHDDPEAALYYRSQVSGSTPQ